MTRKCTLLLSNPVLCTLYDLLITVGEAEVVVVSVVVVVVSVVVVGGGSVVVLSVTVVFG